MAGISFNPLVEITRLGIGVQVVPTQQSDVASVSQALALRCVKDWWQGPYRLGHSECHTGYAATLLLGCGPKCPASVLRGSLGAFRKAVGSSRLDSALQAHGFGGFSLGWGAAFQDPWTSLWLAGLIQTCRPKVFT